MKISFHIYSRSHYHYTCIIKLSYVSQPRPCLVPYSYPSSVLRSFINMDAYLLSALLLLFVARPAQQQREDLNFNFGWRFSLGYTIQCPATAFSGKLDDVQCDGLLPIKNRKATEEECRDACCEDVLCAAWQYSQKRGCYLGQYTGDCSKMSEGMTGEQRAIPAALPPAGSGPGSKEFDDSAWVIVDLPYDGIINGSFDENNLETHGYLPLNTTWYRKHFNLPAEWKGR